MFEGIDTVVLHEALAYHDQLPVQWQPVSATLDAFSVADLDLANVALLQACVAMEEHPVRDKHDELLPLANELARLDLKLNLVLQLLGTLTRQAPDVPPVPVQFNALGAKWQPRGALPAVGEAGILHIRLHSSLPQTLDLPASIAAHDGPWAAVRFSQLSESAAELLQRLCFLRHRRRVADARKARG